MKATACGFSRPISRPKLLPKFAALPGCDAVPVAGALAGLLGELEFEALFLGEGVGSAHASTPSCDSTISR